MRAVDTNVLVRLVTRGVVAVTREQFRKRPKLGCSDYVVLEVARKAGHLPLGTFDRELSKLDGAEKLYAK
jgi:predicted nucleic acid-binding protein